MQVPGASSFKLNSCFEVIGANVLPPPGLKNPPNLRGAESLLKVPDSYQIASQAWTSGLLPLGLQSSRSLPALHVLKPNKCLWMNE